MFFFLIGFLLAGFVVRFIAGCYWIDYKTDGDKKRRCVSCKHFERVTGKNLHCAKLGCRSFEIPDECVMLEDKE